MLVTMSEGPSHRWEEWWIAHWTDQGTDICVLKTYLRMRTLPRILYLVNVERYFLILLWRASESNDYV